LPALFIDRFPTANEMERLRLILSTFQDGSGMLKAFGSNDKTLPGWRDLERSIASFVQGEATESKHIFDVRIESEDAGRYYGYSCKMRGTLRDSERLNDATIEVTNSHSKLWAGLRAQGIHEGNIEVSNPLLIGQILVSTIEGWYMAVDIAHGKEFYVDRSPMLHLAYDPKQLRYRLFCFPRHLPTQEELSTLQWEVLSNRLKGIRADNSRCIEWYKGSGGQFKYYPKLTEAVWSSPIFSLEALPETDDKGDILAAKAAAYFSDRWEEASTE